MPFDDPTTLSGFGAELARLDAAASEARDAIHAARRGRGQLNELGPERWGAIVQQTSSMIDELTRVRDRVQQTVLGTLGRRPTSRRAARTREAPSIRRAERLRDALLLVDKEIASARALERRLEIACELDPAMRLGMIASVLAKVARAAQALRDLTLAAGGGNGNALAS